MSSNKSRLHVNSTTPDVKTNIVNQKPKKNLRTNNAPRKKTIILGYSITTHAECLHFNKGMKSLVSVRSVLGPVS